MNQHVTDRLRFLRAFVANPRQVGAVLPTSRAAVRDMLDMADVPGARLVVELGAGTGVQTGEELAPMRRGAPRVAGGPPSPGGGAPPAAGRPAGQALRRPAPSGDP